MPPKQVQFFLCPTPGAKPEFLATVESITKTALSEDLPERIVLENYTREPWASKPNESVFQVAHVKSVDGRKKLPGFLKYLKDRQKTAFGRFCDKTCVVIVNPEQKGAPAVMKMQFCWDIGSIPGMGGAAKPPQQAAAPQQAKAAAAPTNRKKGAGLLGNLVASQRRTNAHVVKANAKTIRPTDKPEDPNQPKEPTRTAQEAIAEFRRIMEEKLLDFDIAPENVIKIPISVSDHTKGLAPEDLPKMSMEILKYIVYEQAEEINEEWLAHKEPSEFLDEIVIAVYKEGEAPAHIIEEMNQGELPDEVKGSAGHQQQQQAKRAAQQDSAKAQELAKKALQERAAEDGGALNRSKRDRRTIEEIQAEASASKRTRMDP